MKQNSIKLITNILLCMFIGLFSACQEDEIPFISLSSDYHLINNDIQKISFDVYSNTNWEVVSNADWCELQTKSGRNKGIVNLVVQANPAPTERTATLQISGGFGLDVTVTIKQSGTSGILDVSTKQIAMTKEGGEHQLTVIANHDWKVSSSSPSWCRISKESGSLVESFSVLVDPNETGAERRSEILIISEIEGKHFTQKVLVNQSASNASLIVSPMDLAINNETREIALTIVSNESWKATTTESWCIPVTTDGQGDATIAINVEENTTGQARTGVITVTTTNNGDVAISTFTLSQSATKHFFATGTEKIDVSAQGGQSVIHITANIDWKLTLPNKEMVSFVDDKIVEQGIESKEVIINVQPNTTGKARAVTIKAIATLPDGTIIEKDITVNQEAQNSGLVVSPNYKVIKKAGEEFTVNVIAEGQWQIASDKLAQWVTVSTTEGNADGEFTITVAENVTTDERETEVVVFTGAENGERITQTIKIKQSAYEQSITLTPSSLEMSTFQIEAKAIVESSDIVELIIIDDSWCTATLTDNVITVTATPNMTATDRTATILVKATSENGDVVSESLTVTQQAGSGKLIEFNEDNFELSHKTEKTVVTVTTVGNWEIVNFEEIPNWFTIDVPATNQGSSIINIQTSENKHSSPRKFTLVFRSEYSDELYTLNIYQDANPDVVGVNYLYLGKGYDASKEYANAKCTKAPVLDWELLTLNGHVADILTSDETNEHVIMGKTLEEYENNLSFKAGISGSVAGFTASIESNFSTGTLSSAENSFATKRLICQKQVIKLYESVLANDLDECLSSEFINDLERLSNDEQWTAARFVDKYGTHVVTGFVLGGALEYSMTADVTSLTNTEDFGIAVGAGFELAGYGGTAETGFNTFNSVKTASSNFEAKLICKGGDSQYTTNDEKASPEAFTNWLTSLNEPQKWVMIDYAGSAMIPIYEFIKDKPTKDAIKNAVESVLKGYPLEDQKSTHRVLTLNAIKLHTKVEDGAKGDADFAGYVTASFNNQSLYLFNIDDKNAINTPEEGTTNLNFGAKTFKSASKFGRHVCKIQIDMKELDPGTHDKFYASFELVYDTATETWTPNDKSNKIVADGDTFKLRILWDKADPIVQEEFIEIEFKLGWK
ncbi:MAG: BACON domain-containing protein [Marinifilaceae bacterium]